MSCLRKVAINLNQSQSLFQYHHKKNKIYNLHQNIYNTNKHDIDTEEMANLNLSYLQINLTSTK